MKEYGLFGRMVKDRRAELELTLRVFCESIDYDPSNWSKVERGIFRPPTDKKLLRKIASTLKLSSKELQQLSDFAYLDRKQTLKNISEDEYVLKMLPLFIRTIDGLKPTEDKLNALLELIREDYRERCKNFS